jgi:hypothetical protein
MLLLAGVEACQEEYVGIPIFVTSERHHGSVQSYRYNRAYRYRLTNPPKALLNARLDNIAIVPASMLPLIQTLKEKVNTLPKGGVFLCYAQENSRQRKILERVEETFREQGHAVRSMSMGEVYKNSLNF